MIFPQDFEQKLGFDQIRARVLGYCLCSLGEKRVARMEMSGDTSEIDLRLRLVKEMVELLVNSDSLDFRHYFDPEDAYPFIAVEGAFLEEDILYKIICSLQSGFSAHTYLLEKQEHYPTLAGLATHVSLKQGLLSYLESKMDDTGHVRDNASVELARTRRRLKEEEGKIRRIAEQVFRLASEQGWVPEGMSPTIREGRIVIPLLAMHKRRVRGILMDESATGQTVFVEPAEVMDASNEMRDLQLAERREVVKVLQDMTGQLKKNMEALRSMYDFMGSLDFNRAKAKVAIDLDAVMPSISSEPTLHWQNAKHPLLFLAFKGKRTVVPLNLNLRLDHRFLLVSGPNAGGKSVCLKTVGLLQYMAQCGLLVPMSEQSTVGIFQNIFVDIGDQQSIENDLSTYSSHLRNMQHFLTQGGSDTLLLLDELGSGTDPNFGGGIAEAILGELVSNGNWGVATTHYYNLKLFAEQTKGLVNGAMLFNSQKLEPLFILEVGKPGSSFALEIARKTGLSGAVLARAEEIVGKELTGLETLLKTVAEEKVTNTQRAAELKRKDVELQEMVGRYQALNKELELRKKEIIDKAKVEAATLLQHTNKEIEKTIRHIRENKAEKKETKKVRESLRDLSGKIQVARPATELPSSPLTVGDKVRLRGQEVTGTLVQLDGQMAVVQFGSVRSKVKVERLIRSNEVESTEKIERSIRSKGIDLISKQSSFELTLDLRGKRVEEVAGALSQYLDDAVLLGHSEVRILHGKGEGVLRKVVRDYLRKVKLVATFNDEHIERGGDGITVVVLK